MTADATTRDALFRLVAETHAAADSWTRQHGRWVMDRPWYDRIRAAACTEEQEQIRAEAHRCLYIAADASVPGRCPACGKGPFSTMAEFTEHVLAMADPRNREPADGDALFGILIEVREGGGSPHLEAHGVVTAGNYRA